MPRRRDEDEYEEEEDDEDELDLEEEDEEEEEEEEEEDIGRSRRKRTRSDFIDDAAVEDDEEEDEDDEEEDQRRGGGHKQRRKSGAQFFDLEAAVDSDEEEEEEEGEDDFIVDAGADLPDEDEGRRMHRRPSLLMQQEDQLDVDELSKQIHERYSRPSHEEYGEDATEVEQQALLPSVRDPKLWLVKCGIGRERETAVCLMQKYIDKSSELHIRSAIALDHLKSFIYVEAEKEAHVREACKGLRTILSQKIQIVPIKEMTDVLSVESKAVDLARDTWVRMKLGIYKGDLAKVVEVDNVRQRVTVKLIPRIDLQAIARKLDGTDVGKKKKTFVPPPRFFNVDEAREMNIRVERRKYAGGYYELIDNMMFRDGFLYKTVSLRSISTQNIQPSFEELEKFRKPGEDGENDLVSLSTLFANRKKGHFMKGDAVIVIRGDLKNLEGWVEKVEDEHVHIRHKEPGLPKTLTFEEKQLCKYFKPGDHVKVISGVHEGATGMVVKVEGHVLIILSDTTKEDIRVFADNVVESSEVTSGLIRIGDYELHDLVLLDNMSFGVIIRVQSEAFQVLKGVPDRPEVALVKLREIKSKIEKRANAQDRGKNTISPKDIVRVVEGPCKGKQGPVEHIHRGILFFHDRHHLEHAGFICVKAQSCMVIGGSQRNRDRNGDSFSFNGLRAPPVPRTPMRTSRGPFADFGGRGRGGRGHDPLVGRTVKIRLGPYKGYRGLVKEVTGTFVRVELESQMKIVTVNRDHISDTVTVATPYRESSRYGMGNETPMHPSRTPLHPYMTPMRDPGATPIHDGMRTPMRDRAWNPYTPMSPPRENWDDANPATWGASPHYQPGSPRSRSYEAPTPGSGWVNTPGGSYSDAGTPRDNGLPYGNAPSPYVPGTPGGQPMTPNASSYLPGTPGGQPMTPGNIGLDVMSPNIGGEAEGNWLMPDVLVNIVRPGDEPHVGVVKEVLLDGSCKVGLGSTGNGEIVIALPTELEMIHPKKSDKIKIMTGGFRGLVGKLIGIDGSDGIVKLDETYDVKILDMAILAKLAVQ